MITNATEPAMQDQRWRYDYQRHRTCDAVLYRWRHDYQRHRTCDAVLYRWRHDYQHHRAGDAGPALALRLPTSWSRRCWISAGAMITDVTEPAMLDQRWRYNYQSHGAGDAGPALALQLPKSRSRRCWTSAGAMITSRSRHLLAFRVPSKHRTLTQRWFIVGPAL